MFPTFEYSGDLSNEHLNNKRILARYSNGIQIMDHSAIVHILDHYSSLHNIILNLFRVVLVLWILLATEQSFLFVSSLFAGKYV